MRRLGEEACVNDSIVTFGDLVHSGLHVINAKYAVNTQRQLGKVIDALQTGKNRTNRVTWRNLAIYNGKITRASDDLKMNIGQCQKFGWFMDEN